MKMSKNSVPCCKRIELEKFLLKKKPNIFLLQSMSNEIENELSLHLNSFLRLDREAYSAVTLLYYLNILSEIIHHS